MTEMKVPWLPWGMKAFKRAKELDRPILLAISAVWCHWCHVMDQTTYSDDEVVKIIEERYVPIRVDRDQRPDIDKRYNMGGWPSTAFLTPDGEVISGATYVPPQQMKVTLQRINHLYETNKGNFKARLEETKEEERTPPTQPELRREIYQSIVDNLTLGIASSYDTQHGGFGGAPKFPQSAALRLALLEYHLQGHKALLNIVTKTLKKMSVGGIYDKEEGGFFRYATMRDWSVPHYEKMCEDNSKLLGNYLEAYQVTGEEPFKKTAQGILTYIDTKLSDQEKGGFYGSQDANEEYYRLNLSERKSRTHPKIDKTLFTNWNALMITSYLQASITLKTPSYQKFALKTLDLLLEKSYTPRRGMYHYYADEKSHLPSLLTDQTSMAKCLIDAYQLTSNRKFLNYARNIARFIINNLWDETGGFLDRARETETLGNLGIPLKNLDENSLAANVLLRLHSFTGKEQYLEIAGRALEYFSSAYQRFGILAAAYGLAAEQFLHPLQIHIVGPKQDSEVLKFRNESLRAYNPLKTVETIDPATDIARLKKLKYPKATEPIAYVCFQGACTSVEDPKRIANSIKPKQS
jgi:uncharacterized protein YyaL (SSP411 family)